MEIPERAFNAKSMVADMLVIAMEQEVDFESVMRKQATIQTTKGARTNDCVALLFHNSDSMTQAPVLVAIGRQHNERFLVTGSALPSPARQTGDSEMF